MMLNVAFSLSVMHAAAIVLVTMIGSLHLSDAHLCEITTETAPPASGTSMLQSRGPYRPREKVHLPREAVERGGDVESPDVHQSRGDTKNSPQQEDSETVLLQKGQHRSTGSKQDAPAAMAPAVFLMAPMVMTMVTSGGLLALVYWFARDGGEDDKLGTTAELLAPVKFKPAAELAVSQFKGTSAAAESTRGILARSTTEVGNDVSTDEESETSGTEAAVAEAVSAQVKKALTPSTSKA